MKKIIQLTLAFLLIGFLSAQKDEDSGSKRLAQLRYKSENSPDRIISFNAKDFKEYALKYPRPYVLVIYFYASQVPLSESLYPEFNYTVHLYSSQGAIDTDQQPVFFIRIDFNQQTRNIFKYFSFESAPNLVVSKPHMAVVSQSQRQSYLKNYKWRMTHTDGVITTQKMLDFINKRTDRSIVYKPTEETIKYVILMFVGVCLGGVIIYKLLKVIWSHWLFWFIASMIVYAVCMSGIVYCIINGSIQQDLNQRKITFFSARGSREQTFFQGCLVSGCISLTGIILVLVAVASEKIRERYSAIVGIIGLVLVFYLINYIQGVFGLKMWYGPSYKPPEHYLSGPLSVDQGNNI